MPSLHRPSVGLSSPSVVVDSSTGGGSGWNKKQNKQ